MNPVCEDIKDKLVAAGIGTFASVTSGVWGIHVSHEPADGDTVITVFDAPTALTKTYTGTNHFAGAGFQLRARGTAYLATWTKLEEAMAALDRIGTFEVGTVHYTNIFIEGGITSLGRDDNDRVILVVNGRAFRQETA